MQKPELKQENYNCKISIFLLCVSKISNAIDDVAWRFASLFC